MSRIKQLESFLESEPNDSFLNYALAIEYVGLENWDKAKNILNELVERDPDYTATYYHLGKLFQREGNIEKAEQVYEEGIRRTREKREQHKLAELQNALTNMLFDDDE
ncbi:MAG: tetratricopeptide repeat protein [Bacteroidia bacterium]|nr:tetratricopeptide repeat protein [Bacteroidia bacterium]